MKKSLLIIMSLSLASCAPVAYVTQVAQGTRASYELSEGSFKLINDTVPATGIVLALDGVSTLDPRCKSTEDKIVTCRLGDLPANGISEVLRYTGKITNGSVTWKTPDGNIRGLLITPEQ